MRLLKATLTELLALFVDDGSLVLAVIAWVAACVACLLFRLIDPASSAVLLAAGIAVLLAENVVRFARARVDAARTPQ
jgi:hypothetical protein